MHLKQQKMIKGDITQQYVSVPLSSTLLIIFAVLDA